MKPWDIKTPAGQRRPDDSFIIPLWNNFIPSDFYYSILESDDLSDRYLVYVAPREYFDNFHSSYPDSMPIVNILPKYLEEVWEGVYESHCTNQDRIRRDMVAFGFRYSPFFSSYVEKNPYVSC